MGSQRVGQDYSIGPTLSLSSPHCVRKSVLYVMAQIIEICFVVVVVCVSFYISGAFTYEYLELN